MTIETGLVAHLLADGPVSALVGTRVHPQIRPQKGALPAIVYSRVSSIREETLAGPNPLVTIRITTDCWDKTYGGSKVLAEAVRVALSGVGIAPPHLLGSELVESVILDTDTDLSEQEGDLREFRVSQDWMITYLES